MFVFVPFSCAKISTSCETWRQSKPEANEAKQPPEQLAGNSDQRMRQVVVTTAISDSSNQLQRPEANGDSTIGKNSYSLVKARATNIRDR